MICKCGKPAAHAINRSPEVVYLCCACYIMQGYPPADWHPECMKAYNEQP